MVPVRLLLCMITLFLWSMSSTATLADASDAVPIAKPNCTSKCGAVQIPYPFGIEAGCYIDNWFKVLCENYTYTEYIHRSPTSVIGHNLILNHTNLNFLVLNISVEGTVQVANNYGLFSSCSDPPTTPVPQPVNLTGSPFIYSEKNRFVVRGGCGGITRMMLSNGSYVAGCLVTCINGGEIELGETLDDCRGINCCQTNIPSDLTAFNYSYQVIDNTTIPAGPQQCKLMTFLVDSSYSATNSFVSLSGIEDWVIPLLLDWNLSQYSPLLIHGTIDWEQDWALNCTNNGSSCVCRDGYHGNPYLDDGCKDINECEDPNRPNICGGSKNCINYPGRFDCQSPPFKLAIIVVSSVLGALLILICAWGLHKVIKKRKNTKHKEKFFKQNGGLLLEKQSSGDVSVEKIKLFSSEELEKATDNFNANRILGHGGHGTVYKGMLPDGSIVAIKKSKIVDEGEVEQFINEIVILSQIIHRNVVKLMGCCLETEVPLLVYEFIPNGTLSQYIDHKNEEFPLSWAMRLRVSIEVAAALSYLHSATSFPIYHRDIKTSNILLDGKFRAKVADFGTSRTVAIDKTHLTMSQVQGTFGYLDPEYFRSSQFTDKSDVYSFGVVLVELLTGQKPVSQTRPEEWRSLTNYFLLAMDENRLLEILDARVMNEGDKEKIMAVAQLARRCLNMKGKKRPTMKEVAVQLEGIFQLSAEGSDVHTTPAEVEYVLNRWHVGSTSGQYNTIPIGSSSPSDTEPLMFFETV